MLTLFILLAAFLVMLVSLSGAILFLLPQSKLQRFLPLILSLAVGVLLANAFLHLLPDALQHQESHRQARLRRGRGQAGAGVQGVGGAPLRSGARRGARRRSSR